VPDVLFVVAPVLLFAAYTIFILLNEITKAAKTASPLSDFIKTISFLEALPPNLRLRPWGFAPPPYKTLEALPPNLRKPLKRLDLNFYVGFAALVQLCGF
jgi:hypothetical protein